MQAAQEYVLHSRNFPLQNTLPSRNYPTQEYLHRIGIFENNLKPTYQNLVDINKAHLYSIPFENLDLHMGREIKIDLQSTWNKIVKNNRGGWCHEQVSVLDHILKSLGYETRRGTGQVWATPEELTPRGIHGFILVKVADASTNFLLDVGFPDSPIEPLKFSPEWLGKEQILCNGRAYRITHDGNYFVRWVKDDNQWQKLWQWNSRDPELEASYAEHGNLWGQKDPASPFLKNCLVSSRSPDGGRKTLSGLTRIITTRDGKKIKTTISREQFIISLKEDFGINLPNFFKESDECNSSPIDSTFIL